MAHDHAPREGIAAMQATAAAATPVSTPPVTAATPQQPAQPEQPASAADKVRGAVADVIRGIGAGWEAQSTGSAVTVDKAAIYPIETVYTATDLLRKSTANIKYVNKATGLLHTVGMFGGLIYATNTSGMVRATGDNGNELLHQVADLVDGQDTAQGWNNGIVIPPTGAGPFGQVVQSLGGNPEA